MFFVVTEKGLEPSRDFSHYPLKVACLPIPPLGHFCCDPNRIRTCDPQIRNLLLYPTELQDQLLYVLESNQR